jgi:hypothetical protein
MLAVILILFVEQLQVVRIIITLTAQHVIQLLLLLQHLLLPLQPPHAQHALATVGLAELMETVLGVLLLALALISAREIMLQQQALRHQPLLLHPQATIDVPLQTMQTHLTHVPVQAVVRAHMVLVERAKLLLDERH